jgi:S-adenosylmethionine:tRNA ribosyltransferase-isomerase
MIHISDYRYILPEERIAQYPLSKRDESKLLVYRKGKIQHGIFKNLPTLLPEKAFLFFNDTKVIPARIHFKKETGAEIEIFLLAPLAPSTVVAEAMTTQVRCIWHCIIGNLKRWKEASVLIKDLGDIRLEARLIDREKGHVELSWNSDISFAEVVSLAGEVPLPPYLKRNADKSDRSTYQTIYSHYEGAVAAPTAGLHFTADVFNELASKNMHHDFLTLHVSAGTFQPVKVEDVSQHTMHHEQVIVTRKNIENLLAADRFVIAVGTTSMRTLESIYWFGVKLLKDAGAKFEIGQDDPYQQTTNPTRSESLLAVRSYFEKKGISALGGTTSIFIKPGYDFKICNGLITNFHQPGSTLMLLVAAFVGEDWKKIYDAALEKDYRFLSFGDSSLLLP